MVHPRSDKLYSIEVEQSSELALRIDDRFISQFHGVLTIDQCEALGRYEGLMVETALGDSSTIGDFNDSLHVRLKGNPLTVNFVDSIGSNTEISQLDDSQNSTLIDLGLGILIAEIDSAVDEIMANAPMEKPQTKETFRLKVLRYLRSDLWEESQARQASYDASLEVEENLKSVVRNQNFNILCRILDSLDVSAGASLADCIPMGTLIEIAQDVSDAQPSPDVSETDERLSMPSRQDRLGAYQRSTIVEDEDLAGDDGLGSETIDPEDNTQLSIVEVQHRGRQPFKFSWIDDQSVKLEVERYTHAISVDLVRALSEPLDKIAKSLDRNPINQNGHDKYAAIVDHLARRIAGGVMPWESANSVKRVKTKSRNKTKGYPEAIWYTFDKSPNAPRIYFTLGRDESTQDDQQPHRQLVILAETDKAHQIPVLSELTGLRVRALRGRGAGAT